MAYRAGETMRLEEIKDMGINPNAILDIGAHTGQFHSWSKRVWPDVGVFMIEANPLHESTLDRLAMMNGDKYLIAAMGDEEREVTFYTRSDKPHTEGNSYYKEHNYWDIPQLVQESKVKLKKLDDIFEDDAVFELIKIDTQGSELDILKGGVKLISKSSVIVLEIAYTEYNEGAPTAKDIINYMNSIGFEKKMSIGEHYEDDDVIQKDFVFLNKELVK
jgi:FkbM family methyltransferase|tara:strand:+ start:358 stop:1011 length:654 start_codon:yes stop_codon:yes gene_type:complete